MEVFQGRAITLNAGELTTKKLRFPSSVQARRRFEHAIIQLVAPKLSALGEPEMQPCSSSAFRDRSRLWVVIRHTCGGNPFVAIRAARDGAVGAGLRMAHRAPVT